MPSFAHKMICFTSTGPSFITIIVFGSFFFLIFFYFSLAFCSFAFILLAQKVQKHYGLACRFSYLDFLITSHMMQTKPKTKCE